MKESKVAVLVRIRSGLKDRLVDLAKREHRSLNQQIEFLLEHSLSSATKNQPEVKRGDSTKAKM
jgi:hypothetical protein